MDPLTDPNLLPSQVFTTAAALLESVDKRVVVFLRDGRKLYGILRSFDQFANLVLQEAIERIFLNDKFGEIPRGVYIVRGENVALLGDLDVDMEAIQRQTGGFKQVPYEEIEPEWKEYIDSRKRADKAKFTKLKEQGVIADFYADNLY